jgi:hypothetical protein
VEGSTQFSEKQAESTPQRATRPQGGSVETADPNPPIATGSTGPPSITGSSRTASRSSSVSSASSASSAYTNPDPTKQLVFQTLPPQTAQGAAGGSAANQGVAGGSNPRRYDNRKSRRNRNRKNPTRKL